MKKQMIVNVIVLIIVGVAAFFGGTAYGKKHALPIRSAGNFMTGGPRGQFSSGGNRTMMNGGVVAGTILSKDDKSMTVQLANGGSRIVLFSQTTPVQKSTAGTADDLKVGSQVFATGVVNADGSITAQAMTLGTLMGYGPRTQQAPQR